jgi:hypothetical protein
MISWGDTLITRKVITRLIKEIELDGGEESNMCHKLNNIGLNDFWKSIYIAEHVDYRYNGHTLYDITDRVILNYLKDSLISGFLPLHHTHD